VTTIAIAIAKKNARSRSTEAPAAPTCVATPDSPPKISIRKRYHIAGGREMAGRFAPPPKP
jgi:hypothetical protein